MKIVLGSDHAGFELKVDLRDYLVSKILLSSIWVWQRKSQQITLKLPEP